MASNQVSLRDKVNHLTANLNPNSPLVFHEISSLRAQIKAWKQAGLTIGFVPTMGALHHGHLALVKRAKDLCDKVVCSIFINPMQFAAHEDLDKYPRQIDQDLLSLTAMGCDSVYLPEKKIIYPEDFSSLVHVGGPSTGLETDFRPQFFDGVTTIVCKLFNQVTPHIAIFGEKDYQQLMTIKAMVRDLDMDIEVLGHDTLREADGLASSSRNAYLNTEERAIAAQIYKNLCTVRDELRSGAITEQVLKAACERLIEAGFKSIDYIELRHAHDLKPVLGPLSHTGTYRLLAALWLGQTRLIDNIEV